VLRSVAMQLYYAQIRFACCAGVGLAQPGEGAP
jgi:hypothetical protein